VVYNRTHRRKGEGGQQQDEDLPLSRESSNRKKGPGCVDKGETLIFDFGETHGARSGIFFGREEQIFEELRQTSERNVQKSV